MVNFTLKQCTYFRAVARSGGIASAAQTVGVSQPAVAQAISKLEDITGLVLFHRLHARGMELTTQGAEFLRHVDQLLNNAAQIDAAARNISDNRAGTIRLGCFQSLAPFFLAQIINGYRTQMPEVALDVREMLQQDLIDALQQNDLDIAIMYDLGLDPSMIASQPLSSARPYLIVPKGHRLAHNHTVPIREIDSEDFVLFDAPQSREYFFSLFAKHNVSPRIAFHSTSIESVRCSVANGLGVSILSMRPASNVTYDGKRVVPIKLHENLTPTRIVIATNTKRPLDGLAEPLIAYCKEVFKDSPHLPRDAD
ncbi:LysR family transcriptional regulator [Ruegeria hyattellae]|uniref:LysR family transcriptional regulator n=1 Tax=Ruegeria hyattellae TaxID=3233337 RepID=UPI00355B94C5